jgi:hypothetical protein
MFHAPPALLSRASQHVSGYPLLLCCSPKECVIWQPSPHSLAGARVGSLALELGNQRELGANSPPTTVCSVCPSSHGPMKMQRAKWLIQLWPTSINSSIWLRKILPPSTSASTQRASLSPAPPQHNPLCISSMGRVNGGILRRKYTSLPSQSANGDGITKSAMNGDSLYQGTCEVQSCSRAGPVDSSSYGVSLNWPSSLVDIMPTGRRWRSRGGVL